MIHLPIGFDEERVAARNRRNSYTVMFLFSKSTHIALSIRGSSTPIGREQDQVARQTARVGKDGSVSSKLDVCSEYSYYKLQQSQKAYRVS